MAKYDNDVLLELCSKIDLLDYASKSMDFEKRGTDSFAAHCCLHTDKTPSLVITPSKNLFHCFSCGCGGNIINWMMTFENMTFNEAVNKMVSLVGIDIKKLKQCEALSFYKSIHRAMQKKTQNVNGQNRKVLDLSSMEQYKDEIPEEWEAEGISPFVMKKYNIRIDDKANRIVYPVYDSAYNLIGFKGRTRFKNYKAMNIKKYQNYQKIGTTNFFIGMKENHDSIKAHDTVIIFEGIKSGMKVESWGQCDFWLASETSCLNEEQIKILIQLQVKNVIIAYDNDVPLRKIQENIKKLKKFTNVYAVYDRCRILGDKSEKLSPCDKGEEIWNKLLNQKLRL